MLSPVEMSAAQYTKHSSQVQEKGVTSAGDIVTDVTFVPNCPDPSRLALPMILIVSRFLSTALQFKGKEEKIAVYSQMLYHRYRNMHGSNFFFVFLLSL